MRGRVQAQGGAERGLGGIGVAGQAQRQTEVVDVLGIVGGQRDRATQVVDRPGRGLVCRPATGRVRSARADRSDRSGWLASAPHRFVEVLRLLRPDGALEALPQMQAEVVVRVGQLRPGRDHSPQQHDRAIEIADFGTSDAEAINASIKSGCRRSAN